MHTCRADGKLHSRSSARVVARSFGRNAEVTLGGTIVPQEVMQQARELPTPVLIAKTCDAGTVRFHCEIVHDRALAGYERNINARKSWCASAHGRSVLNNCFCCCCCFTVSCVCEGCSCPSHPCYVFAEFEAVPGLCTETPGFTKQNQTPQYQGFPCVPTMQVVRQRDC